MNFNVSDENRFFIPIFQQVAEGFRESVYHRDILLGKLENLTIHATMAPTEVILFASGVNTSGEYPENRIFCMGSAEIAPAVLAYESALSMAHMLFGNSNNTLALGTISRCGCYEGSSPFLRILGDEEYGFPFMYGAEHAIAMFVLKKCDFPDTDGQLQAHLKNRYMLHMVCSELVSAFANAFGKPLEKGKFIDGITQTTIDITPDESMPEDTMQWSSSTIDNLFWSSALLHNYQYIMDCYDELMGEGAYRELMDTLERLFDMDMEEEPLKNPACIALLRRAWDSIRAFRLLQVRRNEESN